MGDTSCAMSHHVLDHLLACSGRVVGFHAKGGRRRSRVFLSPQRCAGSSRGAPHGGSTSWPAPGSGPPGFAGRRTRRTTRSAIDTLDGSTKVEYPQGVDGAVGDLVSPIPPPEWAPRRGDRSPRQVTPGPGGCGHVECPGSGAGCKSLVERFVAMRRPEMASSPVGRCGK